MTKAELERLMTFYRGGVEVRVDAGDGKLRKPTEVSVKFLPAGAGSRAQEKAVIVIKAWHE